MEDSLLSVTDMMRCTKDAGGALGLLPLRCGPVASVRRNELVAEAMMTR
jgi:hypothetical protein